MIGYEGLSRFPTPPGLVALPPDVTLAAAARRACATTSRSPAGAAIAAAGVPPGRLLWVNLSPEALGHPGLLEVAGRLPSRLVIELTEQDTVLNHALLRERLRPWIARGALVAVDDAGAGFTSLEYVADIRPDFLKLSRGMVTGVDADPRPRGGPARDRRVRARSRRARRRRGRRARGGDETLRAMDIDYGQGCLFGRPWRAWPRARGAPLPPRAARSAPESWSVTWRARAAPARRARRSPTTSPAAACCRASSSPRPGACAARPCAASGRSTTACRRPPGIVGRVYRTGEPAIIRDVGDAVDYLPAVPGVHAEVAVPLAVDGTVAGVLDAESLTAIDNATVRRGPRAARRSCLSRLAELGELGAVSAAQQLARIGARLAATEDPESVVRELLAGALELSGYESALIALTDGHGALYPHVAEGPFAVAFAQLTAGELAAMAAWVDEATSSYTVGDAAGRGFSGHEALRRAGAGSLVVLPLIAARERLGLVVIADRVNHRPSSESVELLELLSLQAASGLRMASVLAQLRERSARDPLTGLHASLPQLPPRSGVVILEVDWLEPLNGHAGDDVLRATAGLLRELMPSGGQAFRIGGDEFVVTLDARHAAAAEIDRVGAPLARGRVLGRSVSVGVAVGSPGEPGESVRWPGRALRWSRSSAAAATASASPKPRPG